MIGRDGKQRTLSKVLPAAGRERDDIFKAIEATLYPGWDRMKQKHTAFSAMSKPILAIVITFLVTIGVAILSLVIGGNWEGRGRGGAVAALFNLLNWMGPLGTCGGVGVLIGGCMGLWMMIRVFNPPLEVTLKPLPPEEREEDEEDDD